MLRDSVCTPFSPSHTIFLLLLESFGCCSKLLPAFSGSVPGPRKHGILRLALQMSHCLLDFIPEGVRTGEAEALLLFATSLTFTVSLEILLLAASFRGQSAPATGEEFGKGAMARLG